MTRMTDQLLRMRVTILSMSLTLLALTAPSIGQVEPQPQEASPEIVPLPILPDAFNVLSGPIYFALLDKYRASLGFSTTPPPGGANERTAAPETTGQFTVAAVNDSNQDVEPAVITTLPQNRTTTVYIKYVPNFCESFNQPTLYYSSTLDFANFTRRNIPYAVGYCYQGDPWLDADLTGGGIAPNRLYLTGAVFNPMFACPQFPCYFQPNGVAAWQSDTGGTSWSGATIVDSISGITNYLFDKPAVAVDNSSTSSRGYVYVVYYRYDGVTGLNHQIRFARSTDGGVTFSAPRVLATGIVVDPQVVVSYNTGYVYVLWQESLSGTDAIRLRRSTTNGSTWDPIDTGGPQGIFLGMANDPTKAQINGPPGSSVRAITTTVARFNYIANTVSVVWHERQANSSNLTDVYYAAKTGYGWTGKVKLNTDGLLADQIMRALDYDYWGNYMVTWFDRRNDSNNMNFQLFGKYITSTGGFLSNDTLVGSLTSLPGSNPNRNPRFIGDYQQTWFWPFPTGWKWIGSWSCVPMSTETPTYT